MNCHKTVFVQVFSNSRDEIIRIAADHETYMHPGPGAGRNGMGGGRRIAAFKGQHLQRVPAINFFGQAESGFAPVRIDVIDRVVGERDLAAARGWLLCG